MEAWLWQNLICYGNICLQSTISGNTCPDLQVLYWDALWITIRLTVPVGIWRLSINIA